MRGRGRGALARSLRSLAARPSARPTSTARSQIAQPSTHTSLMLHRRALHLHLFVSHGPHAMLRRYAVVNSSSTRQAGLGSSSTAQSTHDPRLGSIRGARSEGAERPSKRIDPSLSCSLRFSASTASSLRAPRLVPRHCDPNTSSTRASSPSTHQKGLGSSRDALARSLRSLAARASARPFVAHSKTGDHDADHTTTANGRG